ncbi:type IV secretion system protein [Povalibacter sp.]|uniref:type IV secretion system protein n=1 Tax=Povalibacter sp. TaxID=1962978 RepID=UPI002F40B4C1
MGFFQELTVWLNRVLIDYVSENTARIAALLEPLMVSLGVLYVIIWGFMQLTGKIEEQFVTGIKRIFMLAIVLGAAINLWFYNELIVATFFSLPAELASGIIGGFNSGETIDGIFLTGFDVATLLVSRGSVFNDDIVFYFSAGIIYVVTLITALYATFLLTLSRIALSVLLAVGPLFIGFLLFETTKRFFESWIAQLANYALIAVLTMLVAALMMSLALDAARAAMDAGGEIEISDAARLALASGVAFLVMRQVMPMAAGMASGLALSTFGVVSAGLRWGLGSSRRGLGQFARGLTDTQTTRWDSLSRKAGYLVRRGAVGSARLIPHRQNSIRRA